MTHFITNVLMCGGPTSFTISKLTVRFLFKAHSCTRLMGDLMSESSRSDSDAAAAIAAAAADWTGGGGQDTVTCCTTGGGGGGPPPKAAEAEAEATAFIEAGTKGTDAGLRFDLTSILLPPPPADDDDGKGNTV